MRQLIECAGAQDFQTRVWALLLEREAENNLVIGLAGRWAQPLATGKITKADRPRFWAVMEDDHVVAAAMMTPPHRIILTRMSAAVVKFLVQELWRIETILPGVVGPTEVAHGFATEWCRRKKRSIQPGLAMRIYQLDRVTPVAAVPGRLVVARETDLDCVVGWSDAFWRETGTLLAPGTAELRQMICAGQIRSSGRANPWRWRLRSDRLQMGFASTWCTRHRHRDGKGTRQLWWRRSASSCSMPGAGSVSCLPTWPTRRRTASTRRLGIDQSATSPSAISSSRRLTGYATPLPSRPT